MSQEKVPIAEAAARLGLSLSAARKRVQRGSLHAEKDETGQWLVLLDCAENQPETAETATGTGPTTPETHAKIRGEAAETEAASYFASQLIETLRDQNQHLWIELENRDRELETRAE